MKKYIWFIATALFIQITGCTKSDFLNSNPDNSLVIPKQLSDFQAILDNDNYMNGAGSGAQGLTPVMEEAGADNYFVQDPAYVAKLSPLYQNYYIWSNQHPSGDPTYDWNVPYRCIFYANVVLDGIKKLSVDQDNIDAYNNILGSALFYRAFCFYHLAQVFAPPYTENSGNDDLGIPLRLSSDIGEEIKRSTLQQTYDQIINDLVTAGTLLPNMPQYKTRPSKTAVYGMLSRVYLAMEDYDRALRYTDSCLHIYDSLLDYNTLDSTASYAIPQFNTEVIFHSCMQGGSYPFTPIYPGSVAFIDTNFYNSFTPTDLRKDVFFEAENGTPYYSYNGSYTGNGAFFGGIATDEVYLIRAECQARKGNIQLAMEDLNTLLKKRWQRGSFIPFVGQDTDDALTKILIERRKELCFRGLRWTDLRRLNKDPRFAITLKRIINGQEYELPPNDPRYTLPIPPQVIGFHPEMPQNTP